MSAQISDHTEYSDDVDLEDDFRAIASHWSSNTPPTIFPPVKLNHNSSAVLDENTSSDTPSTCGAGDPDEGSCSAESRDHQHSSFYVPDGNMCSTGEASFMTGPRFSLRVGSVF